MNAAAREVLVQAALKGVRQVKRKYWDGAGGYCALGVLGYGNPLREDELQRRWGMREVVLPCPLDGCSLVTSERNLISHLNDDHDADFLTIARKLGGEQQP